jgi:hypothetical protein
MMRVLSLAAILAISTPASADIFRLFVEADVGGVTGKATGGDEPVKSSAFFANAPGFDYGVTGGVQLLFLNAWIEHHQFTDGSRVATWTQFGLGSHLEIGLVSGLFAELGVGAWFGLGSGQQVQPPLDNGSISDYGILLEARPGIGKHLNSIFDVGVTVPVSWGYFFKSGPDTSVTDLSTHYQSIQAEFLGYLRASLHLP